MPGRVAFLHPTFLIGLFQSWNWCCLVRVTCGLCFDFAALIILLRHSKSRVETRRTPAMYT